MDLRFFVHYGLHFIFPIFIAFVISKKHWVKIYLIFLSSMLVDLDHFLADPIFDPNRMSIGFHPLHSYYAIGFYFILLFFRKTRIVAVALLFHMLTDIIDFLLK